MFEHTQDDATHSFRSFKINILRVKNVYVATLQWDATAS